MPTRRGLYAAVCQLVDLAAFADLSESSERDAKRLSSRLYDFVIDGGQESFFGLTLYVTLR